LAIQVGAARDAKNKGGKKVLEIPQTTSVSELVNALNEIGVAPKDLTAIFQNLKAAGALEGELEIL
jgi:flagellar P-ring protein precursor FlgI